MGSKIQYTSTNRIVAVKPEAEAGVFEEFGAEDYNIEFLDAETLDFDMTPDRAGKVASGNMAESQSFSTSQHMTGYTLNTLWRHDGDESTFPTVDSLITASGLLKSVEAGQATYTFDGTQPCETLSVQVTELNCGTNPDGIVSQARGCVPNMQIGVDGIGQQVKFTFELMGAYQDEFDDDNPIRVLQGYDTGVTEKLLNTSFSFGGTPYVLHNYSLNLNNNTVIVPDPSKSGAVYQGKVVGADPVLTVTTQMIGVDEGGIIQAVENDTVFNDITISGNGWDIIVDEGNIRQATKGDEDSIMTYELEIEVRKFRLVKKELVS